MKKVLLFLVPGALTVLPAKAVDTLRVMSYNVLNYGETGGCQGGSAAYHGYLRTIVGYAHPDVLGLVKMGSVKRTPGDAAGSAPYGFGDSVLRFALNAAFPSRYACCPPTNTAGAETSSLLFYDQQKLGYLGTIINYARTTDFNVYKFYYKDPALAQTGDTTFIYFILNHTKSGDSYDIYRGTQVEGYMTEMRQRFSRLPNVVNMGDFNTRSTLESCYGALVAPADTGFRFFETPFVPDAQLSYPANWDANAAPYSTYLTTSTRSGNQPNSCGTSGGAKAWYDHIFISRWLIDGANYLQYLPNSYQTLGNDGQRLGVSVNATSPVVNSSAPAAVADALFRMSNKYPVMADFVLRSNTGGGSPQDPDLFASAVPEGGQRSAYSAINPVRGRLRLCCAAEATGRPLRIRLTTAEGRLEMAQSVQAAPALELACEVQPGIYLLQVAEGGTTVLRQLVRVE